MKQILTHNSLHLGDCIFQLNYFRKLLSQTPDLEVFFYVREENINECLIHSKDLKTLRILNIEDKPNDTISTDLNYKLRFKNYQDPIFEHSKFLDYDIFYLYLFEEISKDLGIENPIKTSEDFLYSNPKINPKFGNKLNLESFDYLIVNSRSRSNQYAHSEKEFNDLIRRLLRSGKKIVTTRKSLYPEAKCTLDFGMSLLDIGQLSLFCNNIIAVNTSPIITCLNEYITDREKILVLSKNVKYSYQNVIHIDSDFNKIYEYL